jgi:hypothetical protein
MTRNRLIVAVFALLATAAAAAPRPARAQVDLDLRGGVYTDASSGFVGAGLLTGLTRGWYFNPNVEYVFVDPGSLWTVNADFHYDFARAGDWSLWAGGGPALEVRDYGNGRRHRNDNTTTDLGFNVLAGVGLVRGPVRPFFQAKVLLSDNTEGVLAVGLRF